MAEAKAEDKLGREDGKPEATPPKQSVRLRNNAAPTRRLVLYTILHTFRDAAPAATPAADDDIDDDIVWIII